MIAWMLPYVLSVLAFVLTFIFIRTVGSIARRVVTKETAASWDSLGSSLAFCAPTVGCALLLLVLRNWAGLILVSQMTVEFSLICDAVYILFTLYRDRRIRQLRRAPGTLPQVVKLKPQIHWPRGDMDNFRLIRDLLQRVSLPSSLGIFSFMIRMGGSVFTVTRGDFERRLGGDLRYVDSVADEDDELGLDQDELAAVPHILVLDKETLSDAGSMIIEKLVGEQDAVVEDDEDGSNEDGSDEDGARPAAPYKYNAARYFKEMFGVSGKCHAVNRTLNAELSDELWETSRDLCRKSPHMIALTWKSFHFQEDLRLRLATLFNAAELVQKLVGSAVLCALRGTGELESLRARTDVLVHRTTKQPLPPPGTYAEWNRTLEWVLAAANSPEVEVFRRALRAPREDISELHEKLQPFREVLEHSLNVGAGPYDALKGLEVIGVLRNRTVGHGTVGWKLNMNPLVYLAPLHQFFLAVMRDIVKLDLGVYACTFGEELEVLALDRGLKPMPPVGDDLLAVFSLEGGSDNAAAVPLNPYFLFYSGRLLSLNRLTRNGGEYVDYVPANIAEPTFINLDVQARDFG